MRTCPADQVLPEDSLQATIPRAAHDASTRIRFVRLGLAGLADMERPSLDPTRHAGQMDLLSSPLDLVARRVAHQMGDPFLRHPGHSFNSPWPSLLIHA